MLRHTAVFIFITGILCTHTAAAQTSTDSVKQTVNQLFSAMKSANVDSFKACLADSAVLQTIVQDASKTVIRTERVGDFISFIAQLQKGDADEQVTFDMIKTDEELAIVWARYKFYWKGKFSHCGTDSFQLVRINGVWKIQYIIDTRRKQN